MSDLSMSERRKLEKLLCMSGGYVLNFSNRTFADFVLDFTGRNVDVGYDFLGSSKANRLRAFWQREENAVVGKLLAGMLDYCFEETPPKPGPEAVLTEECRRIVARLINASDSIQQTAPVHNENAAKHQRSQMLRELKDEFFKLAAESDRNKAGLALEGLLNRLFNIFELQPRQPFRVIGEQIDGSFLLDGQVYLLESKWEKHPLPEADLLVFKGKIEGKSTFTRGVLIALNDVSIPARDAITRGKAPSFFVMNGHDLMMILGETIGLTEFLQRRVRLLAEKGSVCVPFSEVV